MAETAGRDRTTHPGVPKSPTFTAAEERLARSFRFNFIHILEGTWSGSIRQIIIPPNENSDDTNEKRASSASVDNLDSDYEDIHRHYHSHHHFKSFEDLGSGGNGSISITPSSTPYSSLVAASTKITFDESEQKWFVRETQAGPDGVSSVLHFDLIPSADGELVVKPRRNKSNAAQSYGKFEMKIVEKDFGLEMTATEKGNKQNLKMFQLLKLTYSGDLERTILSYKEGVLFSTFHGIEKKVV